MRGSRDKPSGSTELAGLARDSGLHALGTRPPLTTYIASIWARRSFLWALTTSRVSVRHQNTYLGQIWLVLTPLLLAATYYLVFGVILTASRGIDNYVGFLVIGVFIYMFITTTFTASGDSIIGNRKLIQALQFPRATLPIAVVMSEGLVLVPTLGVMVAITIASGERPSQSWLFLPLAFLITLVFNVGLAFITARAVQVSRDLKNVIPLITRLLRYVSGVFFSIEHFVGDSALGLLLQYQPIAVYLQLFRSCLLSEFDASLSMWLAGAAWAIGVFVGGLLIFWAAEAKYGRD